MQVGVEDKGTVIKELWDKYRKAVGPVPKSATSMTKMPPLLLHSLVDSPIYPEASDEIATSAASLPCINEIGRRAGKLEEEILGSLLRDHIRAASRYAILSHRWEHEELEFSDLQHLHDDEVRHKQGFVKFQKFCDVAGRRYGCPYVWADTACIDRNSSTELDESIRSMYTWYRNAEVCLVYLSIADRSQVESLRHDEWFQRGWTLQELLAPKQLKLFCRDWMEVYTCEQYDIIRPEDRSKADVDEVLPDSVLRTIQNYMAEAHARVATTDAPAALYDRNSVFREASAEATASSTDDAPTPGGATVTVSGGQSTPSHHEYGHPLSPVQGGFECNPGPFLPPPAATSGMSPSSGLIYYDCHVQSQSPRKRKRDVHPDTPAHSPKRKDDKRDSDAAEREKVLEILAKITKIDKQALGHYQPSPANARSVFQWVSERETSRAEDMSYCLLGLLDIQMPIAYGEGAERAFFRLQVECTRFVEDRSLFLWNGPRSRWNSMFAGVPSAFKDFPKDLGDPRSLSSNCIFERYKQSEGLDPSFSLTNCGLRIMVALRSVKFFAVSTVLSDKPTYTLTYTLTLLGTADTKVTLHWHGETPSKETITERWKVAVVGGFDNNHAFTILLREGESRSPPRYHRLSSAVFTQIPPLHLLTDVRPKTIWIQ
ncbi:hypothetical protein AB1N83_011542 [Pleurotus pulmonarius]